MTRQDKKAQFEQEKKNRFPLIAVACAIIVAGAIAGWTLVAGNSQGIPLVKIENGIVQIPQGEFHDGRARFYRANTSGGEVKFFLVKSQDGNIRAAFDTCDVCYKEKKGYRQEGDMMVCNNCNQSFRTDLINVVKGGCNPAPLQRKMHGDQVVIQLAALEQGSWYFSESNN